MRTGMRDLGMIGVSNCPSVVCLSITRWYWFSTNSR